MAMPSHPTTGQLISKKVMTRHRLVVDDGSCEDDVSAPLVKHDATMDLSIGIGKIRYTQEPALATVDPPASPLPYRIMGQRTVMGYSKVLVANPGYKGKAPAESSSSTQAQKVERQWPLPDVRSPLGTTEFSESNDDNDKEDEKKGASGELVAALR